MGSQFRLYIAYKIVYSISHVFYILIHIGCYDYGKKLIEIVSEGSVLLTELQRMAQHVPAAFYPPSLDLVTTHRHAGAGNSLERSRFEPLLFDFSYFRNEDEF